MGAGPVNLPATAAAPKLLIIDLRQRLELADDLFLGGRLQQSVATEATAERGQDRLEGEGGQNFQCLVQWILGSQIVAMAEDGVHQEATIAGQESALLTDG